jgi:hypothetical protein
MRLQDVLLLCPAGCITFFPFRPGTAHAGRATGSVRRYGARKGDTSAMFAAMIAFRSYDIVTVFVATSVVY